MASSSSRLKRSSSLGRLAADDDDYRYKMAIEKLRCDLVGFPYCCNKHYSVYRRPPYYADLDYPYYHRWYDRSLRYLDWPYYHRRPWYYDDYYRDYVKGYEEGLQKYDAKIRRSASSADLRAAADDEVPATASVTKAPPSPPPAPATARPLSSTTPLPPPLPSYYDRYPSYWYHYPYYYSDYYYRQPYYWRRYLDSRAY